jgi:hypothetical protein
MSIFDALAGLLDLSPSKALATSMKQSKTLTIMMIVGVILFGSFALFLVYMAGGID